MSWKKHWKTANASPLTNAGHGINSHELKFANWASKLPEVYIGHPNRIERYSQYENMDADSEINAALDILSEFCTQTNVQNGTAFKFEFYDTATDSEVKLLKEELTAWWKVNEFEKRIFKMFRNTIKYGDQIFVRDPETMKWFWVSMEDVVKVIVDEGSGKSPEQYILKDINPNFENMTMTQVTHQDTMQGTASSGGNSGNQSYMQPNGSGYGGAGGSRFEKQMNEGAIAAENIVHCSLTEGMDATWPFGNSVLERIFKVFKQKELLEDSILIYRIQRAPERRVFKIDVGGMPAHMAMAFVDRVKNEIHQRRIPTQTGGGTNMMDATYNPLSTNEDYFFPQTADGRGSSVESLAGGSNLGEIDDLLYFNNKLLRGLRIPSSYLPTGAEDGTASYNDGRLGTALQQEKAFNDYCMRLQRLIAPTFDQEFKIFLGTRGYNIDNGIFDLRFNDPQNFASYRQTEVDSNNIGVYTSLADDRTLSERFKKKRFLKLTDEEMQENDEMWREENIEAEAMPITGDSMRGIGMSPGGFDGDMDLADPDNPDFEDEMGGDDMDLDVEGAPTGGGEDDLDLGL